MTSHTPCRTGISAICLAGAALLSGCVSEISLLDICDAYDTGRYKKARRMAAELAGEATGPKRIEAAYMAGLSAYQLKDDDAARRYLDIAKFSKNKEISGNAFATLGLLYSKEGEYAKASAALNEATKRLAGEDKAKAHFYSALTYRKQNKMHQARKHFALAAARTINGDFRKQVLHAQTISGHTIQTGAFREKAWAESEAKSVTAKAAHWGIGKAQIISVLQDGEIIYLVQIGKFDSEPEAMQKRADLNIENAIVIGVP